MYQEKEIAKKIVEKEFKKRNIKIEKIILFGSRARGDYRKYKNCVGDISYYVNREGVAI